LDLEQIGERAVFAGDSSAMLSFAWADSAEAIAAIAGLAAVIGHEERPEAVDIKKAKPFGCVWNMPFH
jgi:hypothetical protein